MIALGSDVTKSLDETTFLVKELFGMIGKEPLLQKIQVLRLLHGDGYLMRTEGALHGKSVHNLGTGPTLRGTQNDHGPERSLLIAVLSCVLLDRLDLFDTLVDSLSHELMHGHGIAALYEVRLPATSMQEALELLMRDVGQNSRITDLIFIQMQHGKHCTVGLCIQELVGMPCSCKRTGLSLAVADDHGSDQIRVIKGSAERMRDGITKLTALVDGTGRLRCHVAGDTAGEGELLIQSLQSFDILRNVGIYFAVSTLKVRVCHKEISAVARSGDQDHVQIILIDRTIHVRIDEVLSGNGSPVTYDLLLDHVLRQRLSKQGIVQQIQLRCCQIVRCAPVCIQVGQIFVRHKFVNRHSIFLLCKLSLLIF